LFVGIIKNILLTFHQEVNMKILKLANPLLLVLLALVVSGCSGMTPLQMETEAEIAQQQHDLDKKEVEKFFNKDFIEMVRIESLGGVKNIKPLLRYWRDVIKHHPILEESRVMKEVFSETIRGPTMSKIVSGLLGIVMTDPKSRQKIADVLEIRARELTWTKDLMQSSLL
jgi:hypothetical protein